MRRNKVHLLTLDAMLIALLAIMTFVPNLGFIQFSPVVSVTIIHLPVIIWSMYFGAKRGAIYGSTFGLLSLLKAAIAPVAVSDVLFVNPLISVLPRIVFGILVGLLGQTIRTKLMKFNRALVLSLAAGVLTLLHTILVVTMMGLFEPETWEIFLIILSGNGLLEMGLAIIIVPLVSATIWPLFDKIMMKYNVNEE